MKIKTLILIGFVTAAVLFFGHDNNLAKGKDEKVTSKIGVVSVQKIFTNCQRNAKYRQEAEAERNKIIAELEKMAKEIEAAKAGLNTLKLGSDDYMNTMQEIMQKHASSQAKEEFYKQQIAMKDQQWMEKLYEDIIKATSEIAEETGLELVLEQSEVELPAPTPNDLMLTIRTHKLLYSGGCVDITEDVIKSVDTKIGG